MTMQGRAMQWQSRRGQSDDSTWEGDATTDHARAIGKQHMRKQYNDWAGEAIQQQQEHRERRGWNKIQWGQDERTVTFWVNVWLICFTILNPYLWCRKYDWNKCRIWCGASHGVILGYGDLDIVGFRSVKVPSVRSILYSTTWWVKDCRTYHGWLNWGLDCDTIHITNLSWKDWNRCQMTRLFFRPDMFLGYVLSFVRQS